MHGEAYGVALVACGDRDGRSIAVLYCVDNEIRQDLGYPVGVPLAAQVPAAVQPDDRRTLTRTDLDHSLLAHLVKIGRPSLERNRWS